MLAFDDETMFKPELLFSDMNCSSASFDDLGASPNDTDNVMDQSLDALLFGSGSDDLIASQLQSSGQEDCAGELADLMTSDDPHRTDTRADGDDDDDGGDIAADELFAGRSASRHLYQVNTADRSNRPDHDYVTRSSADEDDEAFDDEFGTVVPQTRAAGRELVAKKVVITSSPSPAAKRAGLRSQPRKRCFSTCSTASQGSEVTPVTSRTGQVAKKRKLSGTGSTGSRQREGDKCMTKNAIMARENRQKKKEQFREMAERLDYLEEEVEQVRHENACQKSANVKLVEEVTYLRAVLRNSPEISALIQSIRKTPGIKDLRTSLGTSLRSKPKKVQDENQTPPASSTAASSSTTGKSRLNNLLYLKPGEKSGVCLHVVNGAVSLEFCASCSAAATRALSN